MEPAGKLVTVKSSLTRIEIFNLDASMWKRKKQINTLVYFKGYMFDFLKKYIKIKCFSKICIVCTSIPQTFACIKFWNFAMKQK